MATPTSTANQRPVVTWMTAGERDETDRQPEPAAEQGGNGQGPDAKREHPRMEVRLKRVGAGAGNPVPQRERRGERHRQPRRRIHPTADRHKRDPDQQE